MSKTISINAGSSSLKWQLYLMPEEKVLAKGLLERIGLKDSISTVKFDGRSEKQVLDIADHTQAVKILLDDLKRSISLNLMMRLPVWATVLWLAVNTLRIQPSLMKK